MSLRIGILGFAHPRAVSYARDLEQCAGAVLVGVADSDQERSRAISAVRADLIYNTEAALLTSDLDAVIICAKSARRRELIEMAAAAGKHVLCEPPLAPTDEESEASIQTCALAGVQLFSAFPYRFHPAYARLRQTVHDGDLGEVIAARSTNRIGSGRPSGPTEADTSYAVANTVLERIIHGADLLRDLLRAEPVEVYAEIAGAATAGETNGGALVTLLFNNGVFATLDASSLSELSLSREDVSLYITGTGGTAGIDLFSQNHTLVRHYDRGAEVSLTYWGDDMNACLIRAFVDALTGRVPSAFLARGEAGAKASQVAQAICRSAEMGLTVLLH